MGIEVKTNWISTSLLAWLSKFAFISVILDLDFDIWNHKLYFLSLWVISKGWPRCIMFGLKSWRGKTILIWARKGWLAFLLKRIEDSVQFDVCPKIAQKTEEYANYLHLLNTTMFYWAYSTLLFSHGTVFFSRNISI